MEEVLTVDEVARYLRVHPEEFRARLEKTERGDGLQYPVRCR